MTSVSACKQACAHNTLRDGAGASSKLKVAAEKIEKINSTVARAVESYVRFAVSSEKVEFCRNRNQIKFNNNHLTTTILRTTPWCIMCVFVGTRVVIRLSAHFHVPRWREQQRRDAPQVSGDVGNARARVQCAPTSRATTPERDPSAFQFTDARRPDVWLWITFQSVSVYVQVYSVRRVSQSVLTAVILINLVCHLSDTDIKDERLKYRSANYSRFVDSFYNKYIFTLLAGLHLLRWYLSYFNVTIC